MKKSEITLGAFYQAKISGRLTVIQLDYESEYGGWYGTNLATSKQVRIRSAAKLRKQVSRPAAEFFQESTRKRTANLQ